MQVLLGLESRDEEVAVSLVHDLHVDEPFASHDSFHEAKVEAPNHDDSEDDAEREHDNPVLNIIDVENVLSRALVLFVRAVIANLCRLLSCA